MSALWQTELCLRTVSVTASGNQPRRRHAVWTSARMHAMESAMACSDWTGLNRQLEEEVLGGISRQSGQRERSDQQEEDAESTTVKVCAQPPTIAPTVGAHGY
jgi:hypothetical protein